MIPGLDVFEYFLRGAVLQPLLGCRDRHCVGGGFV